MGQKGMSRASTLRLSSSRTAASGSGKAGIAKSGSHVSNRSTQKAKRGTKTRVPGSKKGKNKPKKPTKQTTIWSGLKRLAAKKGKLVTDSVKRKHVDQVIDNVVLGRVCETRSNCPEPTSLIDGPRMNVSSALAHTEVDANGTVEQVGVI